MGMLDGVTDLDKQSQTFFGAEMLPITVLGDGHTPDQLHHEIRPAGIVAPASKTLAMFG